MISQETAVLPLQQPRIMGQETEYMLMPHDLDLDRMHIRDAINKIRGLKYLSEYLSNGARFYIDVGNHPEYATPECLSGRSVAVAARAGEFITANVCAQRFRELYQYDPRLRPSLYKRTSDMSPETPKAVADHENYFITQLDQRALARLVAPHLAARIIISGSGMVSPRGGYSLDQRAWFMSNDTYDSGSTTNFRPFVLDRNEAHSAVGSRFQVIAGGANMLSFPLGFRFDSTNLVIRMAEHGLLDPDFVIDKPGRAIRQLAAQHIGDNLKLNQTVMVGQRLLTAPQIELYYASIAKDMADAGRLNEYDTSFAYMWHELACDIEDGKIEKWADRIDWLAKLDLMERYKAKKGQSSTEKMQELDLSYHEIRVLHKTVRDVLIKNKTVYEDISDTEATAAMRTAPDDTRARARGATVLRNFNSKEEKRMSWQYWPVSKKHSLFSQVAQRELQTTPYATLSDFQAAESR